ncbi:thioredoxin O2, mitochondrial-like [Momordica charantia]|uniref:Thioredoxin O2, mitochondrial-like n=1 Tax=Momordica charantia TaxID=3673 RepID=A0A6J1CZ91_MOMCH|nr:thioredoxin O2, mitochondrial-like [Momordica charantia]
MVRNLVARWRVLRRVLDDGRRLGSCYRNYSVLNRSETIIGSRSSSSLPKLPFSSSSSNAPDFHFPTPSFQHRRPICSASDPSNIVLITSEDQFNKALRKARDEALPAIFYFTAAWCGPCRLVSPVIKELSKDHPQVTTYKIDIDQEGLVRTLNELNITSVPTFHFFQSGKKAGEIIGADVAGIKNIVEKLYK